VSSLGEDGKSGVGECFLQPFQIFVWKHEVIAVGQNTNVGVLAQALLIVSEVCMAKDFGSFYPFLWALVGGLGHYAFGY